MFLCDVMTENSIVNKLRNSMFSYINTIVTGADTRHEIYVLLLALTETALAKYTVKKLKLENEQSKKDGGIHRSQRRSD